MRAVTNAGPLIHLSWIDQLDILGHLFQQVLAPEDVRLEVMPVTSALRGSDALARAFAAPWLQVVEVGPAAEVASLTVSLGQGEAAAIALMEEVDADLLLLDDRRARREAMRRGLRVTGTVGLLRMGRQRGLIPAAYPLLSTLSEAGFWLSEDLLEQVRREER